MGMEGMAFLNCWFKDDVQAEIDFVQGVNYNVRQQAALAFINTGGNSIAANVSSSALSSRRPRSRRRRPDRSVHLLEALGRQAGGEGRKFEAYRGGKLKQQAEYNAKSFATGKIGFIWSNGIAAFVSRLEVVAASTSRRWPRR